MKHIPNTLPRILPAILLGLAVMVHGFFYLSAAMTNTLDPLYENITPGQDFYQVPNGAYAYLRGGTLQGDLPDGIPPYTDCCGVNRNVYHPLFTLTVGTVLSLMPPSVSYRVWMGMHVLVTLILMYLLYRKFGSHPLFIPAVSLYLLFSYHYYEIKMAQYHFLVMALVFLHILALTQKREVEGGIFLFLSMLVKPIGLLFILPLVIAGRWKAAAVGAGLFTLVTIPTLFIPGMEYYVNNIRGVASSDIVSYNLFAMTYFRPELMTPLTVSKFLAAGLLLIYQMLRKPPLFVVLTAWTAFQILFYSSVYPYYYVTFAGLIALGMVTGYVRPTFPMGIAILILSLPQPAWYFHLRGSPRILPTGEYLTLAVLSSLALVFFITVLIWDNRKNRVAV